MTSPAAWPGQAYLDSLRPERGASVIVALFATYAVDISAVATALLALARRNDEKGSGSAVDFAEAVETLRGRLSILVQRGRIARPSRLPRIAGVLDRFVVEIGHDEASLSWHPKVALVAYEGPDGRRSWRAWIGSRNLTRSRDLDVGVLIEGLGSRGPGRSRLPALGELGRYLARAAGRADSDALAQELAALWWRAPDDYRLRAVHLALAEDMAIAIQPPPVPIDSVTVVSPFLCADFVGRAGRWGPDGKRTLVSTRSALAELARRKTKPLAGFTRVLAMEAPDPVPDDGQGLDEAPAAGALPLAQPDEPDMDGEPPPQTLHAKLYSFGSGERSIVLVGSANATARGWRSNSELLLEMDCGEAFQAGLAWLVDSATPVDVEALADAPPAQKTEADALEESRKLLVAAWKPELHRDGDRFELLLEGEPRLAYADHRLEVGLANGDLLPWPRGRRSLDLGETPLALQTEFIQVRIVGPAVASGWIQRVPVTPPLDEGRDVAAIAHRLGLAAFHEWMRGLLAGDEGGGDPTPWDEEPGLRSGRSLGFGSGRLCLEDILTAWARDRAAFARADRHFEPYLAALLDRGDITEAERANLGELRAIWALARERLATRR